MLMSIVSPSSVPVGSSTFAACSALRTSMAVSPWATRASGSSHSRMAYSLYPQMSTWPTPEMVSKRDLNRLSASALSSIRLRC